MGKKLNMGWGGGEERLKSGGEGKATLDSVIQTFIWVNVKKEGEGNIYLLTG